MDQFTTLKLAVAATQLGGPRSMASQARQLGARAFVGVFESLTSSDQAQAEAEAERLAVKGISATLLGTPGYPTSLFHTPGAPAFLFFTGADELLQSPGIGVCGSRDASAEGVRAATACGEVASEYSLSAISGYARGVDMATHISALNSGGTTVLVLAEGIDHFRVKRGEFAESWDPKRAVAISQFAPGRPWSAATAMTRNRVIIGMGLALVVVEARERGGTIAAGSDALKLNRPVIALEFSQVPRGNAQLLERGAISARNRTELAERLVELRERSHADQLPL